MFASKTEPMAVTRDSFDGLGVFVEVVETGGFSRAAERLALTRSAVAKTIARLEERLGVRLFHRTTRSQTLTEDGHAYFEHCQRALREVRAGQALLDSGRREVRGTLKISMPVMFGRHCVAPLLLDLAGQHPDLELDLRFSDAVVDVIGERFDLAVRNGRPGEGGALQTRKVAEQRKVACAAPSYLAAKGVPATIDDLAEHEALAYWRNEQLFDWTFIEADGARRIAKLNWRFQFDDHEAIVHAAVKGLGVAWVPDWLVRDHMEAGRLQPILTAHSAPPLETYLVWPAARTLPLRTRVAIDWLAARLQSALPSGYSDSSGHQGGAVLV